MHTNAKLKQWTQLLSAAKQFYGLTAGEEALLRLVEGFPLPPELQHFTGFFERHSHLPKEHPVALLVDRALQRAVEKYELARHSLR